MRITRLSLAVLLLFGAAGCSSTGQGHGHDHGPHGHSHASGGHGHSHGAHGHAHGPGGHTHGAAVAAAPERIDLGKLRAKADAPGKTLRGQIEAAMEAHDFLKVVALVDRFRAEEPRDVWSGLMAADALVELGRYAEATDELQRVLNLKPCSAAYLRAGYLLHVRGQSSAGEEILTLALEPGTRAAARAFALHERGRLRWFRGSLASAEADFRAALKLDPRSRQARVGLARVLAARGERDLAAAELERAASTPRLWGELALLQRARGRTAEAARALKTARRLAAADPHHWERSLAVVLADHAIVGAPGIDTAQAVRLARRELTRRGSVEGWDALAWALTADGKPAQAYAAAKRALVHGTQEPLLFFHAGVAAARAGKADDAKRWLRRALSLNTTFHPVFPAIARDLLAKLEA